MTGPGVFGFGLVALALLGALRGRGRASALRVLQPSDAPVDPAHVFLVRPGVTLDEPTRRAASAHARACGLEVLDLISPRIAGWRAQLLLDTTDVATYRLTRVARGSTAGDAILVHTGVLARAGVSPSPHDVAAFAHAARRLKRYAVTETDLAVAPGLVSPGIGLRERRRLLRFLYGDFALIVVGLPVVLLALCAAFAPVWGLLALAVFQLQPWFVTWGSALRPHDRLGYALLRIPIDLASALGPATPPPPPVTSPAALRSLYASLLSGGTERFFETPRSDCPLCGERTLERVLETGDHLQFKPGRFALVRCTGCRHVFQNPRLTLDGLAFYYRDCYDGLGEERLETLFSGTTKGYRARVGMVSAVTTPRRWLDVGAGHGHFCCIARELLPDTRFDGLDLADSIEDAERRRWIARGIRGPFPELAPELAGIAERYDVVSMSHYLEHTLDPRAEIDAAAKVLPPGGLLLIEVPDPECNLGALLGGGWLPWLQPQHLHFLNVKNLDRLLRERSFEPLVWHRGEAHMSVEFLSFAYFVIARLAPPLELPWRPPPGIAARAWNAVVWTLLWPLLLVGWLLDRALEPFFRRPGWSNAYRVLARRAAAAAEGLEGVG